MTVQFISLGYSLQSMYLRSMETSYHSPVSLIQFDQKFVKVNFSFIAKNSKKSGVT